MVIVKMEIEIEKGFFSICFLSLDGHTDERNYDKDGYYFYSLINMRQLQILFN